MKLANGPVAGPVAGPAPGSPAAGGSRLRLLLIGMTSLVLVLGAVFGRHGLLEARQFRLERDRLNAEIDELQRRNAELEREIEALRTDPRAVERIAREDLGLAMPGEKLILLAPAEGPPEPVTSASPGLDGTPTRP